MSRTLHLEITIDWDNYEDVSDELILEDSGILDSVKDGVKIELSKSDTVENTKMFLFARWISICYADEHKDENGNYIGSGSGMSVLNTEDGEWWKKQLDHFNKTVWPNYIKNGSVDSANAFLKDLE